MANLYPNPYIPAPQPVQPQQPVRTMEWVQGIEGAKAFPVGPGVTQPLWDSENQTIYIKMTDQTGIPQPLRILDYTERAPVETTASHYVTAEELNDILDQKFDALTKALQNNSYKKKGGNSYGNKAVSGPAQ